MTEKHNSHIQMIADYEGDIETLFDIEYTGELPILATRNLVVFPGVVCPILIGREQSLKLIKDMERNPNSIFGIFCQQRPDSDNPNMDDLYTTGVYAKVVKVIDMPVPGRQKTAIVQALGRCHLDNITRQEPYLIGEVHAEREVLPKQDHMFSTAIETLR